MTDFLLIHGSRHGAWAWKPIVAGLAEAGHRAVAFDLPAHGDDPASPAHVTLSDYANRIRETLETAGLSEFVAVAHSAGGASLAAAARSLRPGMRRLALIAALVPARGQSFFDCMVADGGEAFRREAAQRRDRSLPIDWPSARQRYFAGLPDEVARRHFERLVPEPYAPLAEPVQENTVFELGIPVSYLLCTEDRALDPSRCRRCAADFGIAPVEIATGHDAMLTAPERVVAFLLEGAEPP